MELQEFLELSAKRTAEEAAGPKEYQCFYLNPEYKLAHDADAEVLFESNNLAECCSFVYNQFKLEQRDIAVWQARHGGAYREYYQNRRRNSKGQFV